MRRKIKQCMCMLETGSGDMHETDFPALEVQHANAGCGILSPLGHRPMNLLGAATKGQACIGESAVILAAGS